MRKSILSVNGSRAMNYLLKTILGRSFKFEHIEDIFQVAHYLKRNKNTAALIIDLDFQPQLCWELIEHVKTSRLYKVPVIILATDTNESLKEKCYQYGID